jgi:predicted SprT family Zn-dependent metalloprotease
VEVDMPILKPKELSDLSNECDETYFYGLLPKIPIGYNLHLRTTAGRAWYCNFKKCIELNPNILGRESFQATKNITVHEQIHIHVAANLGGKVSSHGPLFKAEMDRINKMDAGIQVWMRHNYQPLERHYKKYVAYCKNCHQRFGIYRRKVTTACGYCCNKYNGGHHSDEFTFVFYSYKKSMTEEEILSQEPIFPKGIKQ